MFAQRLLAGPVVWGAVGCEALSVTSCSILFLCCCASALCPPGLTLHCSSNNCCGTLNICKPLLRLTQPPLCRAAVCVFPAQLVRLCAAYFDAGPIRYKLWATLSVCAQHVIATGTFNVQHVCKSKQISKVLSNTMREGESLLFMTALTNWKWCSLCVACLGALFLL